MTTVVGVDVGGTFTDLFFEDAGADARIIKVPSQPDDPSAAVMDALGRSGVPAGELAQLLHGTTIAPKPRSSARAPAARC